MLIVLAEVRVAEEAVAAVRDAIATMEVESRKEPGCITYAFSVDVSDPSMVRISERWNSAADLEAHFRTPHMAAFGAALAEVEVKSMDVTAYEVAREVPLPV